MQTAEVQIDDVIVAGQYLASLGEPVNGWTLRRALGDRGRPDHLAEVWQAHGGAAPAAAGDAGPAALPAEFAEQVDRGRGELAALYDGLALAAYRQADALLRNRYAADLDRLAAERDGLRGQLAAASASVVATEAALGDARLGAERLREALAAARTGIEVSERRVRAAEEGRERDAREAGERIAALDAAVQQFREEATAARAGQTEAQERAEAAEQERAAAGRGAAAAQDECRQLREKVAALTSTLAAIRKATLQSGVIYETE